MDGDEFMGLDMVGRRWLWMYRHGYRYGYGYIQMKIYITPTLYGIRKERLK